MEWRAFGMVNEVLPRLSYRVDNSNSPLVLQTISRANQFVRALLPEVPIAKALPECKAVLQQFSAIRVY